MPTRQRKPHTASRTVAWMLAVLCLPAVLAGAAARAGQAAARAAGEGTVYRTLTPPEPTDTPGKIQVIEFFSYACPHCNDFYPLVSAWVARLPADVVFERVPVGFGRAPWVNLARAYYALQATGELQKLDGPLFRGIHVEHLPLFDEQDLADWVGRNGGDAAQFTAAYVSFGVNNRTVQADRMVEDYRIEAVPTLVVDGRYAVRGDSFAAILANADQVIARVRAQKRAGHAGTRTAR